jgi:hypothetical protein
MESRLFLSSLSVHMHLVFACCARDYERDFSPAVWRIVLMHVTARRIESNCTFYANLEQEQSARQLTCSSSSSGSKTIVHIRRKIMIQMSELSKQEFAEKKAGKITAG